MNHWHDYNMGILKPALSYWSLTCQHLSIYHHNEAGYYQPASVFSIEVF